MSGVQLVESAELPPDHLQILELAESRVRSVSVAVAGTAVVVAEVIFAAQPGAILYPKGWVVLAALVIAAAVWTARSVLVVGFGSARATEIVALSACGRLCVIVAAIASVWPTVDPSAPSAPFVIAGLVLLLNGRTFVLRVGLLQRVWRLRDRGTVPHP